MPNKDELDAQLDNFLKSKNNWLTCTYFAFSNLYFLSILVFDNLNETVLLI